MKRTHVALSLAAAVALVGLAWLSAWWTVQLDRDRGFERAAGQARQLAEFFEQRTVSHFLYGDAYLRLVRREFTNRRDIAGVRALMEAVPLDRSIVSHITIIDASGTPVFNSRYPVRPGVSAIDRDYFLAQRAATGDTLQVSLPHRGRNSDRLVVRIVRRLEAPGGGFGGVIFAAMDAESITSFLGAMRLGPKSSATLVGTDKRIRARSSYGRLGPGQDISGSRIWRELEVSPTGLYLQTSVVDGVTRYYAYRRLENLPLVVAIGVSTDGIAAELQAHEHYLYSIALLASVLVLALTVIYLRELRARQRIVASEATVRRLNSVLEERVRERTAELQNTQAELLRKERLAVLGQLTGTVAHELRNPLGTILASENTVRRRLDGDAREEVMTGLDRIRRNVERCDAIISELLDFQRSTPPSFGEVALDPWLAETTAELSEATGCGIEYAPGAPGVTLRIDRERLRRALLNLVANARDALAEAKDEDPSVQVISRVADGRVEIEVRDTGPGIPEDMKSQVLEPLFSTRSFGVGLGLPVVVKVMEDHGGGLELREAPGTGTAAVMWFPVVNP